MHTFAILAADPRVYIALFGAAFGVTWLVLLWEGQRRRWPIGPWLAMIAWTFTCAMVGSHLAMLGSGDWAAALSHGCIPQTTDKSFLGMVAGGVVGVTASRRLLRLPLAVGDAFAVALPFGLLVGRIGCLLRGCCFGTPADLPWAISYSPGSLAQTLQAQRGLVAPTSPALPVHPVQAYEMVLLLGIVATLVLARRRLKHELSLFLLYAVLQSLVRFVIEFMRDGPLVSRIAGLKPLQLVLLGTAAAAGILLWFCERGAFRVSVVSKPSFTRQGLTLVAVGAITLPFAGWFTDFELAILFAAAAPAALALASTAVHEARRAPARWAATAIAAGSMILLGAGSDYYSPLDEIHEPDYWTVTGAVGGGECAEGAYYGGVSGTAAFTHEFGEYSYLRTGGQATLVIPWVYFSGGSLFVDGNTRWVGLGGGGSASALGVRPFARARFGPSDVAWLEGAYGDSLIPFVSPLATGIGIRLKEGTSIHGGYMTVPGVTPWPAGVYLGSKFVDEQNRTVFFSGYVVPRESFWQIVLGIRYPL